MPNRRALQALLYRGLRIGVRAARDPTREYAYQQEGPAYARRVLQAVTVGAFAVPSLRCDAADL